MAVCGFRVGKLEKKDLIWVIPTAIASTLSIGDWVVTHWSQMPVLTPQTNATSSGYVTVVLPRVTPLLPMSVLYVLASLAVFGGIARIAYEVYDEFYSRKIEVKISPPFICEPKQLAYLLRKEVKSLQIYRAQCLTVKATTDEIESLRAKTWINDKGPYFLTWAPKASEPTSESPKKVDLTREEEVQLPIWYAPKQLVGPEKGFRFPLTIPSDDRRFEYEMDGLGEFTITIEILFIAKGYTRRKRRFMLEARSWDELCLIEKR